MPRCDNLSLMFSSNDHFPKQKLFVFINQNPLDISPPIISLYSKPVCFVGSGFSGSHRRTPHAFQHFLGFHHQMCLNQLGSFTEGESSSSCYYPPHFFSCYATMRLCWMSSNITEPTINSPNLMSDHNHALTPNTMQCHCACAMQYATAC